MMKKNRPAGKAAKITYWIATIWLALGMTSTAIVQLLHIRTGAGGADSIAQLGYPVYFLTIIGVWKLLGVVAVLVPGFTLLKEWAYAGFFFVMSGALFSHLASGNPVTELLPAMLLLVLTMVSWYFRPAGRRPAAVNQ